jgi:hypothetical protein
MSELLPNLPKSALGSINRQFQFQVEISNVDTLCCAFYRFNKISQLIKSIVSAR